MRPNSIEVQSHYPPTGNLPPEGINYNYTTHSPAIEISTISGNAQPYSQNYQDQYSGYPHGYTAEQVDQGGKYCMVASNATRYKSIQI